MRGEKLGPWHPITRTVLGAAIRGDVATSKDVARKFSYLRIGRTSSDVIPTAMTITEAPLGKKTV
jgi:hypothetical protein